VLDKEVLKKAQQNPEQYQNLVVRVSGFNAHFVDLAKFVQDAIIERSQHQI
jgi:formate C-acetyltransferase